MQISKSTVNIDEQYSIFLTIQRSIKWNLGLFGVLSMYTHESPLLHPHLLTACDPEQWDRQALNEKEELQRETWIKPIYSFVFVHLFSSFTWNILSSPPLASLVTQFKTSGGGGSKHVCIDQLMHWQQAEQWWRTDAAQKQAPYPQSSENNHWTAWVHQMATRNVSVFINK